MLNQPGIHDVHFNAPDARLPGDARYALPFTLQAGPWPMINPCPPEFTR